MQADDFRTFMDYPTEETGDFLELSKVLDGKSPSFEFKNVSFRYEGAEQYALKNLNMSFPAGQRLAVVGLNGAGKTTFIKLLLRLYDVTEGEILLNGVNIKRFRRNEYYKVFAPVFQNVELFAFPMAENVSMQSPGNTDKELAKECINMAGLKQKVDSLEKGVDTELLKIVHEDGVDLSGGEKQKLALARALYKNAPVIVLDEPTAALDALAEYELYQNFDKMIQEKSAVYISHRLSSTRFCDVIAMFVAGEMVEYGTHEELLAKGGFYAEIFEVQAQYYETEEEGEV
jgi:ABC-type multidrug transport system fused ATPase/permease subunit